MIWGLKKYIIKIYSGVFFLLIFSTEMLIGMMNGTLTHNERFDEGYAKNWGIAVISSKNKGYIQAFATDPNGMRSFYFDSRTFYIEKMSLKK